MDLGLNKKIVFISGSTRGIGYSTARAYLSEGARVIINGRSSQRVNECLDNLRKEYPSGDIDGVNGDILNTEEAKKISDYICAEYGRLDIFVANLGSGKPESTNMLAVDEWRRFYDVNIIGNVTLLDLLHPLLVKSNDGSVIFISSIVARQNAASPVGYAAAKSAVLVLTKYLSKKWANDKIRVNCVMPGNIYFKGGRWEELKTVDNLGVTEYIDSEVPMKRFGKPEEVADAIVFLSSQRASFITGATLTVDGGQLDLV